MSLFLLQHEELTIMMLDHMVEVNNLEAEMKTYCLEPEQDLKFIKEMIVGPHKIDDSMVGFVSPAHVNCVKSVSVIISTATNF